MGAIGKTNAALGSTGHETIRSDLNTTLLENTPKRGPDARVVGRQNLGGRADEVKNEVVGRPLLLGEQTFETILDGQQEFHAPGSTTDNADGRAFGTGQTALTELFPMPPKTVYRLDGHTGVPGTGYMCNSRRGPDIDGQGIIGHGRPGVAHKLLVGQVQADHFIVKKSRSGEPGQRPKIDMGLIEAIMSGDIAGQHTGIRRMRITANQRQTYTRQRLHAKAFQYGDVAVATSN